MLCNISCRLRERIIFNEATRVRLSESAVRSSTEDSSVCERPMTEASDNDTLPLGVSMLAGRRQ